MTEPHVTAPAPPPMPETAPAAERSASDDILRSRERGHASVQSLSSPQIAIHDAATTMTLPGPRRPSLANHISAPAAQQYQSPMRQHKRTPSQHREIKETLNARSEYTSDDADGTKLRINQYVIREEIGRGSYGAVHLATDQFGNEYATKEFSKARLRRRAQSNILRRPHGPPRPGMRSPWAMHKQQLSQTEVAEAKDALFLIREEIAVMKKLNHPNLVQLIEVLDDPEEDSLWMVLEMCKKGVVMKVGLDDHADPYPEEKCRHWFRDLILGVEYLHAQGVIHRDIKPDNLLLTTDDVLKIVDFGVSEMFEKPERMMTAKSAAADIWSMGVTLYCLKYGRLPFKRDNVLDMYEAIREDVPEIPEDENPDFADIVRRLLDKNADTRICMADLRDHPWVTMGGVDALLSEEENCADEVEMPNELEVNHAFTPKMSHMLVVMMAISKFKSLVVRSRTSTPPRTPRTLQIPVRTEGSPEEVIATPPRLRDTKELAGPSGLSHQKSTADEAAELIEARKAYRAATQPASAGDQPGEKGHAHEVTDHEPRLLGIGLGARDEFTRTEPPADIVSDSPTGIDFDIYDRAFEAEVERIRSNEKRGPRRTTYLTRFVNEKEKYFGDDCMVLEAGRSLPGMASAGMNKASAATLKALEHLHLGADGAGDGTGETKREQLAAQLERGYLESQENVQAAKDKAFRFADVVTASMQGVVGAKGHE